MSITHNSSYDYSEGKIKGSVVYRYLLNEKTKLYEVQMLTTQSTFEKVTSFKSEQSAVIWIKGQYLKNGTLERSKYDNMRLDNWDREIAGIEAKFNKYERVVNNV